METEILTQAIAKTLGAGADRIPLRRALRMCLPELDALRARGLTWGAIAALLTKAGARHKQGQAISEHQLRTEYGRLSIDRDRMPVASRSAGKIKHYSERIRATSTDMTRHRPPGKTARPPRSSRLADILKTRVPRFDLDD